MKEQRCPFVHPALFILIALFSLITLIILVAAFHCGWDISPLQLDQSPVRCPSTIINIHYP